MFCPTVQNIPSAVISDKEKNQILVLLGTSLNCKHRFKQEILRDFFFIPQRIFQATHLPVNYTPHSVWTFSMQFVSHPQMTRKQLMQSG